MDSSSAEPGPATVSAEHEPAVSGPRDLETIRRRLVRLALKLIWNRDDAEEIVQDAFHAALKGGPGPEEARFEPWMVRTVSFLCLNRRRKKRPEALADWMDVSHGSTADQAAAKSAELERLRQAIEKLPDQQRLALVLRMMEQLDYERISEIMQTSASAVRANVHLARRKLVGLMTPAASEAES